MKITGWTVDGFGIFSGYSVRDLPDGLTVFSGPNEAGKSTLLAFLRFMLFGFGSREPRYLPRFGGRHGGRLFLSSEDGQYVLERVAGRRPPARLTRPDGIDGDQDDLRILLGGADDRVFRSVFAFSLTELQSFDTLSTEGVRDRIFAAGIAGTGRSARAAIGELERQAAGLLKPRGQSIVTDLVGELSDLSARVSEARASAGRYAALVEQEETWEWEIKRLGELAEQKREERATWLLLADIWPVWNELETVAAALRGTDAIDQFPSDAETRLAALTEQLASAEQTVAELEPRRQAVRSSLAALQPDAALASIDDDVESLFETLALHRDLRSQLPAVRLKMSEAADRATALLSDLGPAWSEADVERFDASMGRHEEIRDWAARVERASAEVVRRKSALETAVRRREQLDAAYAAAAEAARAARSPEGRTLEESERAVRRLRANLAELRVAEAAVGAAEAIVHDRERSIKNVSADIRPVPSLWVVSTVWLLAAAAVFAIFQIDRVELALVGLLLGLVVASTITYGLTQKRRANLSHRARQQVELRALETERIEATGTRDRHRQLAAELGGRVAADAEALGLPPRPAIDELEQRESAFSRWRDELARLMQAERDQAAAAAEATTLLAALEQAERAAADQLARWRDLGRVMRLPDSLSPAQALVFIERIRACREQLAGRDRARAQSGEITARVGAWEARARAVLAVAGISPPEADASVESELAVLRQRCRQDRETRAALASATAEFERLDARLKTAEPERQRIADARRQLLADAGAIDDATFKTRLEIYRRRAALKSRAEDLERQVASRIGRDDEAAGLRATLAAGRVDEWQARAAAAEREIAHAREERDRAIGCLRDVQRTAQALAASSDLAGLDLARAGIETELRRAAREWLKTVLAGALIELTLRDFERTRQPAVVAEASRRFAEVTAGRYVQVVQQENESQLAVIDSGGAKHPAESLSRGTAEQLYLCIRFALAAEFGRRSRPLPLIMDDVLVNFDPGRARTVAATIAEYARTHQVIMFTCHPATRHLLVEAAPDARIVELIPPAVEDMLPVTGAAEPPGSHHPADAVAPASTAGEPTLLDLLE
jgi:uncharacterized protein YhaN